jgi:hypothetical protein
MLILSTSNPLNTAFPVICRSPGGLVFSSPSRNLVDGIVLVLCPNVGYSPCELVRDLYAES